MKAHSKITLAVIVGAFLSGCGVDPIQQRAAFEEKAKAYLKEGKIAEAVIELRNAAEVAPQDAGVHLALAQAYMRTGRVAEAREQYQKSLAIQPQQPRAQAELAALLLSQRKFDEADPLIRALLKDRNNTQAHLLRAQQLFGTKQADQAINEYKAAIALEPGRIDLHAGLATVLLAAGRAHDARKELEDTASGNPRSLEAHLALAQFLLSQGEAKPAETAIRAAIDIDPAAVAPQLVLASIYARTKRTAEAENLYIQLKKDNPQDARAYTALGQFLVAAGQRDRAIQEFQTVLTEHPNAPVKSNLVDLYLDAQRFQDANGVNQQVLKTNPNNSQALIAAGRILLASQQYAQAAAKFEAAVKADPQIAEGFYWLGQAQSKQALPSQAANSFKEALKLNPAMQAASVALAEIGRRSGDLDQADKVAASATPAGEASPPVQVERAKIMTDQGRTKESDSQLQRVLESNPVDIPALTEMVRLYGKSGKSEEAVRRLSSLVRDHDSDANLHFLLGLAYYDARNFPAASSSAHRAIELNKSLASAYTLLANTDLGMGKLREAIDDLLKAIEVNPRNVTNYMALENIYKLQGRWDDAKRICEQAYRMSPAPAIAVELAFLYLDHGGDATKALSLAQEASRQMPSQPVVSDILGWALYKTGSTSSAIRELEKAVAKDPSSVVFNHHLGVAYLATGKKDAAKRCLELVAKQNAAYAKNSGAADLLASISTAGSQKLTR